MEQHAKTQVVPDASVENRLPRVPDALVFLAFSVAVFCLLFLASMCTCFLGAWNQYIERTFFLPDSLFTNAAFCLVAVALCLVASRTPSCARVRLSINDDERVFRWCRAVLLALVLVVGLVIAFTFQIGPRADARFVQDVAHAMLAGDFTPFREDGYVGRYPHQLGLVWFDYYLAMLFGAQSYLAFRMLNALALCVQLIGAAGIVAQLGGSRCQQLALLGWGLAFYPAFFYICFLYGTLIGLAFATFGLLWGLKALDESPIWALPCAVALSAAAFMKHNYEIFAIAVVLYALMRVTRKNWRAVLLVVLLVPSCFIAQATVTLEQGKAISGCSLTQGVSTWAWIAMGLQEGDLAPGWYNGYNSSTYSAAGCNTEAQAAVVKRDLALRLAEMADNPRQTVQFFAAKTASQWANPGYQGHWVAYTPPAEEGVSDWVLAMVSLETEKCTLPYLNALQTLVLFGAFIACMLLPGRLREEPGWVLLALVFLGGFVCHFVWEAKCQYTIVYYLLLFPLAVRGYAMLPAALERAWRRIGQLRGESASSASPIAGAAARMPLIYGVVLTALCLGVVLVLVLTGSLDCLTVNDMGEVRAAARVV